MDRSLTLNPGNALALAEAAMCYCFRSEFHKAVPLARRAIELSPIHSGWFRMPIACSLFKDGKAREALVEQKKAPMPGFIWYHAHLIAYYAELGDVENMEKEANELLGMYPDFAERIATEGRILCITKPFYNLMASAWRKAGFDVGDINSD